MNENTFKFWKIPLILILLFFISVFNLPYGFYTFLRIAVCALSATFAFFYYINKEEISVISVLAIIIAILWNPIAPIYLDKETWVCLDVIAIVLEIIMLIFSYKLWEKTK